MHLVLADKLKMVIKERLVPVLCPYPHQTIFSKHRVRGELVQARLTPRRQPECIGCPDRPQTNPQRQVDQLYTTLLTSSP